MNTIALKVLLKFVVAVSIFFAFFTTDNFNQTMSFFSLSSPLIAKQDGLVGLGFNAIAPCISRIDDTFFCLADFEWVTGVVSKALLLVFG